MLNCVGGNEARRYVEAYRNYILNHDIDIDPVPEGPAVPADITVWLTDEARARTEGATINRGIVDSLLQFVHSEGFLSELSRSVEQRIIEARNNCFDNYVDYRYIEPSGGVSVVNDILRSTCSLKDLFENKCEVENGDN